MSRAWSERPALCQTTLEHHCNKIKRYPNDSLIVKINYFCCLRPVSDSRVFSQHGTDGGQLVCNPLHHAQLVTSGLLRVEELKALGEVESENLALIGKERHVGLLESGNLWRDRQREREGGGGGREIERERGGGER